MLDKISPIKLYSQEAAEKLAKAFSKVSLKEAKGEGTFEVIATTEGIDRDGEVILVSGWNFDNFMKNPIMLWGHNYWEMEAIVGAVTDLEVKENQVVVRGIFASTESGQLARKLYDDGILKAVSVGFIPKNRNGNTITEAELLEISFVSVPANPDALSLSKFSKMEQIVKTVTEEEKKDETKNEGEQSEEGQEGEPKADPKAIPKEVAKLKKLNSDLALIIAHYAPKNIEADEKAGRVLSSKNRTLIQSCVDSMSESANLLSELLSATEPEKGSVVELAKGVKVEAQQLQRMLEGVIKNAKLLESNL